MSDTHTGAWAFTLLSVFTLAYYPGYEFGQGSSLVDFFSSGWPLVSTNIMPVIFFLIALYFFREADDGNVRVSWYIVMVIVGVGIAGFGIGSFLGWTTID